MSQHSRANKSLQKWTKIGQILEKNIQKVPKMASPPHIVYYLGPPVPAQRRTLAVLATPCGRRQTLVVVEEVEYCNAKQLPPLGPLLFEFFFPAFWPGGGFNFKPPLPKSLAPSAQTLHLEWGSHFYGALCFFFSEE